MNSTPIVPAAFKVLGLSGGTAVQFGEYSAFPHGSSKPQHLKKGDIVLVDGVGAVEGYRGDISRTTVLGKPTDVQRQRWELEKKRRIQHSQR